MYLYKSALADNLIINVTYSYRLTRWWIFFLWFFLCVSLALSAWGPSVDVRIWRLWRQILTSTDGPHAESIKWIIALVNLYVGIQMTQTKLKNFSASRA